jgi:hypothetical protein
LGLNHSDATIDDIRFVFSTFVVRTLVLGVKSLRYNYRRYKDRKLNDLHIFVGWASRPSRKDGRDAHPTKTIKNVSYLILIPKCSYKDEGCPTNCYNQILGAIAYFRRVTQDFCV